jgi:hypothetical protein
MAKKIDFIDINKQKWGADYIWTKLQEFKKMFDEENPPAPSTDYENYQRRNMAQNIDIRQRGPLKPCSILGKS